jgi:hypothetical protein
LLGFSLLFMDMHVHLACGIVKVVAENHDARERARKGDYWPESPYMKILNERPSPSSGIR